MALKFQIKSLYFQAFCTFRLFALVLHQVQKYSEDSTLCIHHVIYDCQF